MGRRLLLIAFLLVLGVLGGLLARRYLVKTSDQPAPTIARPVRPTVMREVLLYFTTADGHRLEAENRQVEDCPNDEECLLAILQSLVDGPNGDRVPVLPDRTRIRSVKIEDDLVTVDFSRDFIVAHPGGSHSELLTVYAVVDTLAVNFPYVRQVRFLVEGKAVDTIKGHVDLRAPVIADFRYVRSDSRLPELPAELFNAPSGETRRGR
ncbi:sporulation protein [Geothermobacter hydrogeniphilus]|uniref:Sporulation protein n=1 Tax=Geothermobacter hydrogeniphilus TaxID=1969733 RepID=A0A2K2H8N4_9BACT|nr:GerMN domain-containing protein [Geothermobacter hydrogeniphilus]PNU19665.1 sporulation protein [Geothermobacter hydrogeniphilus]